jgi:Protein of unknown function (DUF3305)
MSLNEPLISIPIGVVIERRKAKGAWADFVWRPAAVLPGVPDAAPWTKLDSDSECTRFYAGSARIELHRSDVSGYRDNLRSGAALLWVVLQPSGRERPYTIAAVTAEPSQGEAYSESAINLVDTVPMPAPVRAIIAQFVTEHCAEQPLVERAATPSRPGATMRPAPQKARK